jgi:hypothetical protein
MTGPAAAPPQPVHGARTIALAVAGPGALVAGLVTFLVLRSHGGTGGPAAGRSATATAPAGPAATGPVAMPAPSLADRQAVVCRALLAALPDTLRDRARRPVTAGAEQNAAYGDPPITLACAAGPRPSIPPDATVYPLSGVCWFEQAGAGGTTVWTAIDREVPITVTVPSGYPSPGQWVIVFSAPIANSVPSITAVPTGCTGP